MAIKKTYDPTKVVVIVGTVPIRGFADGDMVTVEFTNDHKSVHEGTDGEYRFVSNPSKVSTVTIRVSDYSIVNAALTLIRDADVAVPITIKDKNSVGDLVFVEAAVLQKTPNYVKSTAPSMLDWAFIAGGTRVVFTGAATV